MPGPKTLGPRSPELEILKFETRDVGTQNLGLETQDQLPNT